MFGAISRRMVTGGALLLAAFLAADATEIDDDLPDLADQIAQMAAEVALELQQICPPASPSDQAAFDRCRSSLFGDSALRGGLAPGQRTRITISRSLRPMCLPASTSRCLSTAASTTPNTSSASNCT